MKATRISSTPATSPQRWWVCDGLGPDWSSLAGEGPCRPHGRTHLLPREPPSDRNIVVPRLFPGEPRAGSPVTIEIGTDGPHRPGWTCPAIWWSGAATARIRRMCTRQQPVPPSCDSPSPCPSPATTCRGSRDAVRRDRNAGSVRAENRSPLGSMCPCPCRATHAAPTSLSHMTEAAGCAISLLFPAVHSGSEPARAAPPLLPVVDSMRMPPLSWYRRTPATMCRTHGGTVDCVDDCRNWTEGDKGCRKLFW